MKADQAPVRAAVLDLNPVDQSDLPNARSLILEFRKAEQRSLPEGYLDNLMCRSHLAADIRGGKIETANVQTGLARYVSTID